MHPLRGSNGLSGCIPDVFAVLVHMTDLVVAMTKLEGPLPCGLASMQGLKTLFIYRNMLYGALPDMFFAFSELTKLDFSKNQLLGT